MMSCVSRTDDPRGYSSIAVFTWTARGLRVLLLLLAIIQLTDMTGRWTSGGGYLGYCSPCLTGPIPALLGSDTAP